MLAAYCNVQMKCSVPSAFVVPKSGGARYGSARFHVRSVYGVVRPVLIPSVWICVCGCRRRVSMGWLCSLEPYYYLRARTPAWHIPGPSPVPRGYCNGSLAPRLRLYISVCSVFPNCNVGFTGVLRNNGDIFLELAPFTMGSLIN